MKLKAIALALLLAGGALLAPVNTLADPTPAVPPEVTCIKAQSDAALTLRITNNGTHTLVKGMNISYSYKTSANGASINGMYKLESDFAAGQFRSFLVVPQSGHDTPIYQCTARVRRVLNPQPQPKNPD